MATTKKKKPAVKKKPAAPKKTKSAKSESAQPSGIETETQAEYFGEAQPKSKKTAAPKVQTIYDAMLTGHAWHFGKYKTKNNVRELIPATLEDLKEIAAEHLEANKTLIHSDDLEEAEHLCTILTLVRKAAR